MQRFAGQTVVIAGGSGFIGQYLARRLADQGASVVILSRSAPPAGPWRHETWDGRSLGPWVAALEGCAGVVNLVGRTVDCVKTPDHCDEILRSRVESTRVLGLAMRQIAAPPPVWVQMATAHIHGDSELLCDEDSPFGYGLAPTVGRAWEEAFAAAVLPSQRGVVVRTSFVLGKTGGALPVLRRLARLGIGGTVSHGRQGMSWIHELDMSRLLERGLSDATMRGTYIASAPKPISNANFMRVVRKTTGGLGSVGVALPSAAWMIRLAAATIVRTDPELVLYGRYVVSKRLTPEGFAFAFAGIEAALADLRG